MSYQWERDSFMSRERPGTEPLTRTESTWRDPFITQDWLATSISSSMENTSQTEDILRGTILDNIGSPSTPSVDGEDVLSQLIPTTSPSPTVGEPKTIFEEVSDTVRERQLAYGSPRQHWTLTMGMLNSLLKPYLKKEIPVSMWPRIMILDKLARSVAGEYRHDHAVDVMGYAAGWSRIEEENPEVG